MAQIRPFKIRVGTAPSTSEHSILRGGFLSAAILFISTCVVGVIAQQIMDATGAISKYLQNYSRYSANFITEKNIDTGPMMTMLYISIAFVILSIILSAVWEWRFTRSSMSFIFINYVVYAVAQGIGFGLLFMLFKATELIAIFGIAGGIFGIMAAVGYFIKRGERLVPYLIAGLAIAFILSIVSLVLYLTKVYDDQYIMFVLVFTGLLVCLFTVFDVFRMRKLAQYQAATSAGSFDVVATRRITLYIGFHLASDLIALIWIVVRIYSRTR